MSLALVAAMIGCWLLPGSSSAAPLPRIDMKVLLVGTSATEPDFVAWQAALQREGVRFDTIVGASHTPITASTLATTLADGTREGRYQAIIIAVGGDTDCSVTPCVSDLSAAELAAVASYEQEFEVRQITGYAFPSASNGLNAATTTGALDGIQGSLTADGQKVFPSLKGPVKMDTGTYGYEATPVSTANLDTLVVGPNGSALVGVYTHSDGVQEMVQTFDQNQNQLQSELLRHGALAWVTRGVYFGDQRNYLETNIDDNFLADDSWDTTAHATNFSATAALRERASDVDYGATWSAQNQFRIDQLFNGGGSVQFAGTGSDPLLAEFKKTNPATGKPYTSSFGWINHTWDHPNLDQGCATQNYIEAEIQQNAAWGASASGLNLTSTADPTVALGAENLGVVVTGEHSGLANLLPGNPGIIDPPSFDSATVNSTGGTLPAGSYTYAITDQFSPTGGESSASETVQAVPANGSVALSYGAVCHASDYKIYREITGSNVWTLVTTIPANTGTSSFADPASTTDVTGGGPLPQSYTDTGAGGAPSPTAPPTVNGAVESAYEQNQTLDAAFKAIGIKTFGSDSSKPYPSPANATFPNGSAPTSQYANGATFTEPLSGAQAEARYPTNIYYNVSTEAQEVDEYNHLYLPSSLGGACVASSTTTCETAPATFADIINSVDQGMFQHIMGNDPRPDYFHQTNMMGAPPAGPPTTGTPPATSPSVGDGLYYSTMNQLLAEYNSYFNVAVQQPTSLQIAQLLAQQAAWAANNQVSGYIQGNKVTITNAAGTSAQIPLTGITSVGTTYGGTQSGWTNEPAGTSSYTAQSTWPAPGAGQAPQGNWVDQLGTSGDLLAGWNGTQDVSNLPNITPTLVAGTRTTWAPNTTDVRALQSADGSTVRNATAYTDPSKVTVSLGFTNAYTGDISIYALDWNKQGRAESISLDDGSGPRIYLLGSDFSQGEWLTFPVAVAAGGTVTISATNTATATATTTPTAVISGIMIGGGGSPPTAKVSSPDNNQSYYQNQTVTTSFSCSDATGPGISACTDTHGGSGTSGSLDTSALGTHTYTVTATSGNGQKATAVISYTVTPPSTTTTTTTTTPPPATTPPVPPQPPTPSTPPTSTPPTSTPPTSTPPTSIPVTPTPTPTARLRLRTVHAHAGYAAVAVTGPAGARVMVSEKIGRKTVPIAVVHLVGGTATVSHALIWRCAPRHRKLVARTLSPASAQTATVTITTPSCSKRLAATVAPRSGVRGMINVKLHDLWGAGLLQTVICLTAPGGGVGCRSMTLRTGQQRTLRLAAAGSGRWKVSISTQFGEQVKAIAWVI